MKLHFDDYIRILSFWFEFLISEDSFVHWRKNLEFHLVVGNQKIHQRMEPTSLLIENAGKLIYVFRKSACRMLEIIYYVNIEPIESLVSGETCCIAELTDMADSCCCRLLLLLTTTATSIQNQFLLRPRTKM